jgi:drug/metabolite transporter (DMT)-like permease
VADGLGLGLAALAFGGFFVAMDRASEGGVLWAVALNRWTSLALLVLCAARLHRRVAVARADRVAVIGVGTLDIAANVLFAAALTYGVAGPVSVLGSLYPLTTVFLAFVVLRERVSGPQGLGAATALAGVGLVAAAT